MSGSEGKGKDNKAAEEVVAPPPSGKVFHRRRGDLHQQEGSSYSWLLTFTDTTGLMLTFFVLMFAMSEPEQKGWSEITSALHSEFNKFYGAAYNRGPQDSVNIAKINFNQALNINYLNVLMEQLVTDSQHLQGIRLIPQQGQLVISMPRDLLFDAGDAVVKSEGSRALYALGGTLARIKNKIEIIGHADPRPLDAAEGPYDSNWELSMMRAANVAAILENVGYQNEIVISGDSSGRYEDLQGIADEQERLDLARRVDIIVLDHDGSKQKVFFDTDFQ